MTPPTSAEGHATPPKVELVREPDSPSFDSTNPEEARRAGATVQRVHEATPVKVSADPFIDNSSAQPVATEDFFCRDAAGVRRIVRAGSIVPLGYQDVPSGKVEKRSSGRARSIVATGIVNSGRGAATETSSVYEEGETGESVAPNQSIEASAAQATGREGEEPAAETEAPAEKEKESEASAPEDYSSLSNAELQAEADKRKLEVKGTGKRDKVTHDDLVTALTEDDNAKRDQG